MSQSVVRFEDGAAYDQGMGRWSEVTGGQFLDWTAPAAGLRWIDIGCGSGAFTELLIRRCAPTDMQGIDPSEGQLTFARSRPGAKTATFQQGDAMALPFDADRFDAAVMALVIFFVPDPAKGVAEMARVVAPGGLVAAYAWDMQGGGFPFAPIQAELRALGVQQPLPPSVDAARMEMLRQLWTDAGLEEIETTEIVPRRMFASFEDFWIQSTMTGSIRPTIAAMTADEVQQLKDRVRARMTQESDGRVIHTARANAIKGRVPK
jgi:ubiquinone/menaquinone biosynthesis C-methylase UbiE